MRNRLNRRLLQVGLRKFYGCVLTLLHVSSHVEIMTSRQLFSSGVKSDSDLTRGAHKETSAPTFMYRNVALLALPASRTHVCASVCACVCNIVKHRHRKQKGLNFFSVNVCSLALLTTTPRVAWCPSRSRRAAGMYWQYIRRVSLLFFFLFCGGVTFQIVTKDGLRAVDEEGGCLISCSGNK